MLLNERIFYRPFRLRIAFGGFWVFPDYISVVIVQFSGGIGIAVRAVDLLYFSVGAAVNLPCGAMGANTVIVQVFNAEEVILVAGYSSLTSAPAGSFHGVFAHIPVHNIHLVNELLYNVIAR